MTKQLTPRRIAAAAAITLIGVCGISACAAPVGTIATGTSPATTSPGPETGPPLDTGPAAPGVVPPTMSTADGTSPSATAPARAGTEVLYGEVDLSDMRWSTSCLAMTTSPNIIATGHDGKGREIVIGLTADGEGALIHLTIGATDLAADLPSLSVLPLANQGEGTFVAAGQIVESSGVGVLFDGSGKSSRVPYQLRLTCNR